VEIKRLGPAHSKGDAVAYLPKEKILITGDLCVNWTWGNDMADPDADYDNWTRVPDDLARWDVRTVVPGHSRLAAADTLLAQREYIADIVRQVRTGVRATKTADHIVPPVKGQPEPNGADGAGPIDNLLHA
jgi:cyclase